MQTNDRLVCSVRTFFLTLVALMLPASLAAAQAPASLSEIFRTANEAAFQGNYATAATGYEQLVDVGVDDPDVFYDLGLAYAHLGRHGRAVASFERALRARPGDAGALAGLEASRTALGRRRAEREGEAVVDAGTPFGESLFGAVSEDMLAGLVLALMALFFGLLTSLSFAEAERTRLAIGVITPLVGISLAILGFGLLARTGAFDPGPPAIVVREDASLREGPSPAATERHRAVEGERAYVLGSEAGFAHVVLGGGREGWVDAEEIVPL
jgi:tetratricopeptide (TPR) repeat protein